MIPKLLKTLSDATLEAGTGMAKAAQEIMDSLETEEEKLGNEKADKFFKDVEARIAKVNEEFKR